MTYLFIEFDKNSEIVPVIRVPATPAVTLLVQETIVRMESKNLPSFSWIYTGLLLHNCSADLEYP